MNKRSRIYQGLSWTCLKSGARPQIAKALHRLGRDLSSMSYPRLHPKILSVFWIEKGWPRSVTHVSKLGSYTRSSDELLIGKS